MTSSMVGPVADLHRNRIGAAVRVGNELDSRVSVGAVRRSFDPAHSALYPTGLPIMSDPSEFNSHLAHVRVLKGVAQTLP